MNISTDTAEAKVRRYHGYFVMDLNSNVVQRGNDVVLASDYDALQARYEALEAEYGELKRLLRIATRAGLESGYSTEWCLRMAELAGDAEFTTGPPSAALGEKHE